MQSEGNYDPRIVLKYLDTHYLNQAQFAEDLKELQRNLFSKRMKDHENFAIWESNLYEYLQCVDTKTDADKYIFPLQLIPERLKTAYREKIAAETIEFEAGMRYIQGVNKAQPMRIDEDLEEQPPVRRFEANPRCVNFGVIGHFC